MLFQDIMFMKLRIWNTFVREILVYEQETQIIPTASIQGRRLEP